MWEGEEGRVLHLLHGAAVMNIIIMESRTAALSDRTAALNDRPSRSFK
jgi:hypothetical protein